MRYAFALGNALLLLIAFRGLLLGQDHYAALKQQIEGWFFLAESGGGGVVIALALWVLLRRRGQLHEIPYRPGSPVAIGLCFAAAGALLAWSIYAHAIDLMALGLPLACLGLAALRGGAAACRALALPIFMLLFAISLPPPLYNAIVWKLQLWTARSAASILELVGVGATVSADLIFRDRHVLSVIEGCSGLRGIEILTLLSLLMKELFQLRIRESIALLVVAPLIAFALNGVRIAGIALLPNPDEALEHTGQGILTLIGGCLLLFGIVLLMERARGGPTPQPAPPVGPPPEPSVPGRGQWIASTALVGALLAVSFATSPAPPQPRPKVGLDTLIPTKVGRMAAKELEIPTRFMGQALFREWLHRRYERPNAPKGGEIELFAGIGARDDTRFSSLSPKTALPGSGWLVEESSQLPSRYGDATLDVVVARAGTARRLVHRFTAGQRSLLEETLRSITGVDATRFRSAPDEVVVRISTPMRNGSAAERRLANARLASFARALKEPLEALLHDLPAEQMAALRARQAS
jgi:exosortase